MTNSVLRTFAVKSLNIFVCVWVSISVYFFMFVFVSIFVYVFKYYWYCFLHFCMNDIRPKSFDLLKVLVQIEVITTLAHFYDPPLRCFSFQDFQLAPTHKEFEQILDFPKKKKDPCQGIWQVINPEDLVITLKILVSDLILHYRADGGYPWSQKGYLERKAKGFANAKNWESFEDVLALLIFGLVLFPNLDDFVDSAVISEF